MRTSSPRRAQQRLQAREQRRGARGRPPAPRCARARRGGVPAQRRLGRQRCRPARSRRAARRRVPRARRLEPACTRAASSPASTKPRSAAAGPGAASSRSTSADPAAVEQRVAQVGVAVEVDRLLRSPAGRSRRRVEQRSAAAPRQSGRTRPITSAASASRSGVEPVEAPRRAAGGRRAGSRARRRARAARARARRGEPVEPAAGERLEHERAVGRRGREHARQPQVRVGRADRRRGGLGVGELALARRPSAPSRRRARGRRRRGTAAVAARSGA